MALLDLREPGDVMQQQQQQPALQQQQQHGGSDEESISGLQTWPRRGSSRRKPSREKELPTISALPVSVSADLQ